MPVDVKQVIAETFAGLLEHKNVEKITVKELVDACHISRQTFYYHFQDTMEVTISDGTTAAENTACKPGSSFRAGRLKVSDHCHIRRKAVDPASAVLSAEGRDEPAAEAVFPCLF